MNYNKLVRKLDDKFISERYSDVWKDMPDHVEKEVTDTFKDRMMGLMLDYAQGQINNVYTATFPSKQTVSSINDENTLLVTHQAADWDISKDDVFTYSDTEMMKKLQNQGISLYVMHVPLDDFHEYSTAYALCEDLNLTPETPFFNYKGGQAGIMSEESLNLTTITERIKEIVNHEIKIYDYSGSEGRIGVVGGGGLDKKGLKEMKKAGATTLVTGVTAKNDHSKEDHSYAKKNDINVIGMTHYTSEKFAMMKLTKYFEALGLDSTFIAEQPVLEDM